MAAADTPRAIGAVTRLIRDHLLRRGLQVSVGKPEEAAGNDTLAKLNLFLYEVGFDANLRNVELRRGDPPPLWLVLKYLLTAFDDAEHSDSADAHELLGRGIAALQELSLLRLLPPVIPSVQAALQELVADGLITADEVAGMAIPIVGRNEKDLISPFAPKDRFEGLSVEHLEVSKAEDRFWHQFQADKDADGFGASWAAFLRASVFGCLFNGLAGGAADPRVPEFADRLQRGTAARLAAAPAPVPITLASVVLVKNRPT